MSRTAPPGRRAARATRAPQDPFASAEHPQGRRTAAREG